MFFLVQHGENVSKSILSKFKQWLGSRIQLHKVNPFIANYGYIKTRHPGMTPCLVWRSPASSGCIAKSSTSEMYPTSDYGYIN